MITHKFKKQHFILTAKLLPVLLLLLFVPKAKADTLNNFQFYRGKTLLVAGCENGRTTYRTTTNIKQLTIHPTDTFHFNFHYCAPHVNVTQHLVLRDSLHRELLDLNSDPRTGDIMVTGATLIHWLKAKCPAPIEFCFFEMENKPVVHTTDENGNRAYFTQPRPPAEFLFMLPVTLSEN